MPISEVYNCDCLGVFLGLIFHNEKGNVRYE